MNQLLGIDGDKLVIDTLKVSNLEGPLQVSGPVRINNGTVFGAHANFMSNVSVGGTIEADVLKVNKIITSDAQQQDAFTFTAGDVNSLDGQGVKWNEPKMLHQLVFRSEPPRLFSSESIDLRAKSSYQIGGIDVLKSDRLGPSVVQSSLRSLGVLDSLRVAGDSILGETVVVNSTMNRVGVNTENPHSALSVVDTDVEIVVGASGVNRGFLGTYSAQTLEIGTDNTARITIGSDGAIVFGNSKTKNANVKIFGTLEVENLVTDSKLEKSTPLIFKETEGNSIYGKGLVFQGAGIGNVKQFTLLSNPDRLHSTENLSLAESKVFLINNQVVLTENSLGETVRHSNLNTVGLLESLSVKGSVDVEGPVNITKGKLTVSDSIRSFNLGLDINSVTLNTTTNHFNVEINGESEFSILNNGGITIGNRNDQNRSVSVHGRLAVNISNPDPTAAFSVNGTMIINGKKQSNADSIPTSGTWSKGDIVWNTDPKETDYIGWVCVREGTPGEWKAFGYIGTR